MSKYQMALGRPLTDEERQKLEAYDKQFTPATKPGEQAMLAGMPYTAREPTASSPAYAVTAPAPDERVMERPYSGPTYSVPVHQYFTGSPPTPIIPIAAPPSMSPTGLQPSAASVPMTRLGAYDIGSQQQTEDGKKVPAAHNPFLSDQAQWLQSKDTFTQSVVGDSMPRTPPSGEVSGGMSATWKDPPKYEIPATQVVVGGPAAVPRAVGMVGGVQAAAKEKTHATMGETLAKKKSK